MHNISVSIQRQSRAQQLVHSYSHPSSSSSSSTHPTIQHHRQSMADTTSGRDASRTSHSSRKTAIPKKKREKSKSQAVPHPPITSSSRTGEGRVVSEATPTTRQTGVRVPQSPQIMPTTPSLMDTMPAAHNILASQVCIYQNDSIYTKFIKILCRGK